MALDVLRLQNPWVTGVSKGLENLAQHKLKQIERQTTAGTLKSLGYPPELALLPEKLMEVQINNINQNRRQAEKLAHKSMLAQGMGGNGYSGQSAIDSTLAQYGYGQPQENSQQLQQQNYPQQQESQPQQPINYRNEMLDYSMGNIPQRVQQSYQPQAQQQQQEQGLQGGKSPQEQQKPRISYNPAPLSIPTPSNLNEKDSKWWKEHTLKLQDRADKSNVQLKEDLAISTPLATDIVPLLEEYISLLDTGKVAQNVTRFNKYRTNNYETQRAENIANQIVDNLSEQGKGSPTISKINFKQTTKPSITQSTEVQRKVAMDYLNKFKNALNNQKIFDAVLAENNNHEPENMAQIIRNRSNEEKRSNINQPSQRNSQLEERNTQSNQPSESQEPYSQSISASDESTSGVAARNVISNALKGLIAAGTTVTGIPAAALDIGHAINDTGKPQLSFDEMSKLSKELGELPPGSKEWHEKLKEFDKYDKNLFPSSRDTVAKYGSYGHWANELDKLSGGYTAPKNALEELGQGITSTIFSMVGGKASPYLAKALGPLVGTEKATKAANTLMPYSGRTWTGALIKGALSEVAGSTIKEIGGSPTQQALAKMAMLLLLDAKGGGDKANETKVKSYEEALESIPKSPIENEKNSIDITNARHKIREDAKNFMRGHLDKEKIAEFVNEVEHTLKDITGSPYSEGVNESLKNTANVEKLIDLKQKNNLWYKRALRPGTEGEKFFPADARPIIGKVNSIIREELDKFGIKNPKFGKPYALAEDIHAAQRDSGAINRFIEDNASLSFGLKSSFGKAIALGALYTGIGKISDIINKIISHPAYRKEYFGALDAAAKNNLPAFVNHATRLDKMGEEYDKKNKR